MEEDIKALRDYLDSVELYDDYYFSHDYGIHLENLIKAYKNLEQIEQVHKEINGELRKRITELEENNSELNKGIKRLKDKNKELSNELIDVKVDKVTKNYIPKSKIKDKIEELEKEILEYETYRETGRETDVEYYDFIASSAEKKVLKELLKGEEK